eukprot:gnl/TRDRNA2_/TRDRNA2_154972_c3_seq1.p2 gnl/TRDRNA2_/TRDRNA2_154972_c3~~gnl/TRDRNA2_/TRDRNA2_154972_c3_seq1.p2  ORF type:complete len:112 (-),score=27.15 gnl/TRDRNA2_/TRDRNA2_154972_c3_seq1:69-404(-)
MAFSKVIEQQMDDFDMQHLASTAWAFAKDTPKAYERLFKALVKAAEWCASDCKAQTVACTACAFAKSGESDVQLFRVLNAAAERNILGGDFKAQELHIMLWALVRGGQLEE